jgi:hypothetical protein
MAARRSLCKATGNPKHPGQRSYHELRNKRANEIIDDCETGHPMTAATMLTKTTRWSIVLSCADSGSDDAEAQAALAEL